jgi:hypothetical protein
MRCSRCGNDNPGDNRFCGMCGATLLPPSPSPKTIPETQTQRAASAAASLQEPVLAAPVRPPEPPRPAAAPAPQREPSISGPSFLGLNDPAPPRKRASLSIDPHHGGHSGNVDYLLEDEEEPKHGGAAKGIFILVVLLIVVGFGYLRWRNNGFRWSTSTENKPPAAEQSPPDNASAPAASAPSVTPEPAPATSLPTAQPAQPAAKTNAAAPANSPGPASAAPSSAAPSKTDAAKSAEDNNSADNADENSTTDNNPPAAAAAKPAKAASPKPAKPAPAKPSPAARAVKTGDTVSEAQKYLYGKGVPQDCDRGLRLLKPAANEANPKAMIEMGALYSAGLCTPRDLPTAYRWFAQALRKDPDNMAVQTDLQKLWGEMTQPERQLAIKLSQ